MTCKRRFSLMLLLILLTVVVSLGWTSSTRIALHQENEFVDGRVHYEGRFIGEEASIPCEVNFGSCGQIYFLTWSKNSSSGWQRVFLYSESYQTAMGDFETSKSRVSLDASNITSHGLAVLIVKSVSIEDEGIYKCDVTYIQGACPSLTYTKLFTLVTPGEPFVRVNGRTLESYSMGNHSSHGDPSMSSLEETVRVGPIDEGSMVTMECSSTGGRPLPDIKWFDRNHQMKTKISVSENPESGSTVTSTAKFIITRKTLDSRFTCSVSNNATSMPFIRVISFDVRAKPLSLKIRSPSSPVVAGEMVSLTCTVEGARPAASIAWFNRSELVDPQPFPTEELMEDATFRYDHDKDFSCMGTNEVLKERNEVPLLEVTRIKVLYPPECKVRLLPKEKDGHTKVECRASSSPPVVSFKWMTNNQTVMDVDAEDQDSLDQRSVLLIREASIESLVCSAKNMMGSTTCILQAHQMQVTAVLGDHGSLPCELDLEKCGPPTQISWSKNSSNEWQQILSESYHLKQPMHRSSSNPMSKAKTTASSYPVSSASFSKSDLKFLLDTSSSFSTSKNLTRNSLVLLKIKEVSMEDEGTYKCDVVYREATCPSVTFTKLQVTVLPSPPVIRVDGRSIDSESSNSSWMESPAFSFLLPSKSDVIQVGPFLENTTLVLDCLSSHGKPLPQVKWFNGSRQLPSHRLEGEVLGEVTGVMTTVTLTRSDLTSVFSCQVTNNATLRPFVKWLVFDIHVEPTRLQVRGPVTPVNAGELVSFICIVEGARPAATVTWFNQSESMDPQPLPSIDVLSDGSYRTTSTLMFEASRFDHEKELSCAGTNFVRKEASKSPLVDASSTKVFFIPECTVRLESGSDAKSKLTCDVISSPAVLNYTWIRGNKSLSEDAMKLLSLNSSSISIVLPDNDPAEAYSCIVSNSVGTSKACRLQSHEFTVPSGWVRLLLKNENLIIVAAAAAGLIVFIMVSGLVVGVCVVRRKLKGLDVGGVGINCSQLSQHRTAVASHHYSRDVVNHKLKSENKIASILEQHRDNFEDESHYTTITDTAVNGLSSPLKSPLIRNAYHQISLRPEGSPLLSDYMTEGSPSPTSTSSSIQHFYERPAVAQQPPKERNSGVHYSLHHLNIPLTDGPQQHPPLPPERQTHRMLLQHRMQTLQHPHHHFVSTGSSHTPSHVSSPGLPQSLQPLRQLIAEASQQQQQLRTFHAASNAHQTVYRSLSRNNRSRFEYSDFYP